MSKLLLPLVAALALSPLAACKPAAEVVDTRAPDPMKNKLANAAPVELPPAITATVTFRCQPGNTLMYVEFFNNDKQVNVRTEKGGKPTKLLAPEAGQPYTAEGGWKLTGTPKAATIVAPGIGTKTCKA